MYGVKPAPDEASDCGAAPDVFVTGARAGGVVRPGGVVDGGVVGGVVGGDTGGGAGAVGGGWFNSGSNSTGSAAKSDPAARPKHKPNVDTSRGRRMGTLL